MLDGNSAAVSTETVRRTAEAGVSLAARRLVPLTAVHQRGEANGILMSESVLG